MRNNLLKKIQAFFLQLPELGCTKTIFFLAFMLIFFELTPELILITKSHILTNTEHNIHFFSFFSFILWGSGNLFWIIEEKWNFCLVGGGGLPRPLSGPTTKKTFICVSSLRQSGIKISFLGQNLWSWWTTYFPKEFGNSKNGLGIVKSRAFRTLNKNLGLSKLLQP